VRTPSPSGGGVLSLENIILLDWPDPTTRNQEQQTTMPVIKRLRRDYKVVIVDPPWEYGRASHHHKLTGYSSGHQYEPLSTADLKAMPMEKYTSEDAVLFLWTTWPFIEDALGIIDTWGFKLVTGLPWVKITKTTEVSAAENPTGIKPAYGVGYWMRGCTEPILIAKRPKAKAVRTNYVGLLSENFSHSRKPDSLYDIADKVAGEDGRNRKLELFARRERKGWHQLGDELPGDGRDIREVLK
jgi:site-specific DNA-methyltransferase (adenine-specific)